MTDTKEVTSTDDAANQASEAPTQATTPSPPTAIEEKEKDTPYENDEGEGDDDDDDDEETCGFCRFMKAGGCKQAFVEWSTCVDKERESGNDFTEECRDVTLKLRECMLANREYYAPLLEEEEEAARIAAEEAAEEEQKEDGEQTEILVFDLNASKEKGAQVEQEKQ